MSYDAIIVGGRVAGASTAMLLARKGLRVLVVDRAKFPSDTLSSHQLQPPGAARLRRWGLLDALETAGTPPTREVRFCTGDIVLRGRYPSDEALYSPRRTLLDALLVDAARAAGAEVRENTIVDEVLTADGRVIGIRCHAKGLPAQTEHARIVVGADGKHSLVARTAQARTYRERPPRSLAFYTYWQDVPLDTVELYSSGRRLAGAFPTNDGLTITYVGWPLAEFDVFRRDPLANVHATLDAAGTLGERVRAGGHVGPLRGTVDLPNAFRRPYGPGWALAGDAGLVMDSITGQGIGHALRDADLLAAAVADGLGGTTPLRKALAGYAKARDRETKAMYDMTVRLASFPVQSAAERRLFAALADDREAASRFFGVISGTVPPAAFFTPANLVRLVGVGGFAALARGQLRPAQPNARAASTAQ
jgi:flavin-dependent dehydrogenase